MIQQEDERILVGRCWRLRNYNGIRGIIAVDGDCQSIRSPPYGGGGSYDARQIVTEFLAHHPAISFVTTTYCECTGFIDRGYHLYHYIHFQRRLDQRRAQHLES